MGKYTQPDPDTTRRLLLDALMYVLSEKGYSHLSARDIAMRAGVHSSMIGYYFNSFYDLLKAYIYENKLWIPAKRPLNADPGNPKEYLAAILKQQFYYLLECKDMQKIIHWQLSQYHPVISSMAWIRDNEGLKLLGKLKGRFTESGVDLEALTAILLAGLYALVLYSNTGNSSVFGIDIKSSKGQERVCRMIDLILENIKL